MIALAQDLLAAGIALAAYALGVWMNFRRPERRRRAPLRHARPRFAPLHDTAQRNALINEDQT